jgi:hypothetical protein
MTTKAEFRAAFRKAATPAERRAVWVAALRSGLWKQGRNRLRDGDKFCCLGVACDLTGRRWRFAGGGAWFANRDTALRDTALPDYLRDQLGLKTDMGVYNLTPPYADTSRSLSRDNDDGADFAAIAATIEAAPPGLLEFAP